MTHQTMTVSELRARLAEYPDDMPVFPTWEGVYASIEANVPAPRSCRCAATHGRMNHHRRTTDRFIHHRGRGLAVTKT